MSCDQTDKVRGPSRVVSRLVGALLLAAGGYRLVVLLGVVPVFEYLPLPGGLHKETFTLDLWMVSGWPVYIAVIIPAALLLVGGGFLVVGERVGWIPGSVGLLYYVLLLFGADYALYLHVRSGALRAKPLISDEHWDALAPDYRRAIGRLLLHRLRTEGSDAAALAALKFADLDMLTSEDVPAIIAAARSTNYRVAVRAFSWLSAIATPEAEQALLDIVEQGASQQRDERWYEAVFLLAQMRPGSAPSSVLELARSDLEDRSHVIRLLGSFRDPRVLSILLEALRDEDPKVRRSALRGLSHRPGRASERAVQQALHDQEPSVRRSACSVLNSIGTEKSIPLLIEAMKASDGAYQIPGRGTDYGLRNGADHALAAITDAAYGQSAEAWEGWWQTVKEDYDLRKGLRRRLFTLLPSPSGPPGDHYEAFKAIYWRDMRELAPELVRYLQLPNEQAPWKDFAAHILVLWGYGEGIAWMIEHLDDNEEFPASSRAPIGTLGRACRVNFFGDKERWRKWWQENSARFPSAAEGT